jgi:hypothetical protein
MWSRALSHLAPRGRQQVVAGIHNRQTDTGFEEFSAA